MAALRVTIHDGKYTAVMNDNGTIHEILRHGEPWGRDVTGDGFILALVQEIIELRSGLAPFVRAGRRYNAMHAALDPSQYTIQLVSGLLTTQMDFAFRSACSVLCPADFKAVAEQPIEG